MRGFPHIFLSVPVDGLELKPKLAAHKPIPVTAQSKTWVFCLLFGLQVRIPRGYGCLSLESVVCCQVEVATSD